MPSIFEPDLSLLLGEVPPVKSYSNARATPFKRSEGGIVGALYSEDGALIEASTRVSGVGGDKIRLDDPYQLPPILNTEYIEGNTCYLGHVMNHYGHLITEGLSAMWALENVNYDKYALHPFIFERGLSPITRQAFIALGIDLEKVILIDHALQFENISIPTRAWQTNKGVYQIYNNVLEVISRSFCDLSPKQKIYLSRRNMLSRAISNEILIEALFQKYGFIVLQPELLEWNVQLTLYSQANVIAGFGGSALHNVLFCPLETPVIVLGDMRAPNIVIPNQRVCASLRMNRIFLVPFAGGQEGFDLKHLEVELSKISEYLQ